MKKFSLTGLCLCLAAITMIGCDDDGDKHSRFVSQCDVDCESLPNISSGACNNDTKECVIVCHANYYDCDGNYNNGCESKDPTCANQPGPGPDVNPPAPDCALTFQYTNVDTCSSTGGTQDWPVYLIGAMNNWDPANTDFALTDSGNCVRKLVIDLDKDSRFTKGSDYSFKFYVSGWGDDSWRFNPNGANDGENNTFKAECGTVVSFDEKTQSDNPGPGPGPGPNPDDCMTTFTYYNEYANAENNVNGVYLVGDFNDWLSPDENGRLTNFDSNYKMSSDGNGKWTIQVKLSQGSNYKYKYYIDDWAADAWKTDAADGTSEGEANISSCGLCFGNACGSIPGPGPGPSDGCYVKLSYTNVYTKKDSGGAEDFDVYIVGDMNGWNAPDDAYKMNYEGNGKHTFNLKIDDGATYKYKFYVNGWGDNCYHANPDASVDGDGNNQVDSNMCGQSVDYVEAGEVQPPIPADECYTTFKYYNAYTNTGSGGAADFPVHLVGEFNEWLKNDSNYTMQSDGKGCHTIKVKFEQGSSTTYKYHIEGWENTETGQDDGWQSDPYNTNYDNDGNSTAYIESCGMTFGGCPGDDGSTNPGSSSTVAPTNANAELQGIDVKGKTITITFKSTPSEVSGGVSPKIEGNTVVDTVPENSKYTYFVKVGDGEVYVPVWVENEPFDWHDAILYFAFTDRFVNGDTKNDGKSGTSHDESDWYGGDFKGMTQKVNEGYFDELGVNTLWISSVSMNTQKVSWGTGSDAQHSYSAYHSYWPISAFMTDQNKGEFGSIKPIEPHFGTEAELKALVDACHKKGIRVLVDFAANHVHTDSPMLSKHPDWFNDSGSPRLCDDNNNWDNYSEKCWFSKDLPDINYDNADARRAMVDHAIWLIKSTNIDGFRVDAVKHMNIQFIKDLRAAVDQLFTNTGVMFYMVGETFTGDKGLLNKYIGDDLLHAQFDFPLYYKIGNVLRGHGLYDAIYNGQSGYKADFKSDLMGTFMGNHDVARAISVAAGQNENKWGHNDTPSDPTPYNRLKAAWMILLTQPGVPLIYYGDEFGMAGSNDPDNRRMMMFGDQLNAEQKGTLSFIQNVGKIRRAHKALSRGERKMMSVPIGVSDNSTVCYKMTYDKESIIVGIGMEASGAQIGSCKLDKSYSLVNLFNPSDTKTADSLDLSGDRFQLWLVK